MGFAEVNPFSGELRVGIHKGHEPGGEGCPAACRFGAGNLLGGNLQHPQFHLPCGHGLAEDFVQNLRVGVAAPEDAVLVTFAALTEGAAVLFHCFLSAQNEKLLLFLCCGEKPAAASAAR